MAGWTHRIAFQYNSPDWAMKSDNWIEWSIVPLPKGQQPISVHSVPMIYYWQNKFTARQLEFTHFTSQLLWRLHPLCSAWFSWFTENDENLSTNLRTLLMLLYAATATNFSMKQHHNNKKYTYQTRVFSPHSNFGCFSVSPSPGFAREFIECWKYITDSQWIAWRETVR